MNNITIKHSEEAGIGGTLVVRSFPKGIIGRYLDSGMTISEAIQAAINAGLQTDVVAEHNLVVTAGKTLVGNLMTGKGSTGLTYIGIGTGTTAAALGDTKLQTEVRRKAITDKVVAGATITLSSFFLASESTYSIQEIGFFGALASAVANSGTLFSRTLLAYNNTSGTHDLTFEYTLTIT